MLEFEPNGDRLSNQAHPEALFNSSAHSACDSGDISGGGSAAVGDSQSVLSGEGGPSTGDITAFTF